VEGGKMWDEVGFWEKCGKKSQNVGISDFLTMWNVECGVTLGWRIGYRVTAGIRIHTVYLLCIHISYYYYYYVLKY
jgi:hypothetical protein